MYTYDACAWTTNSDSKHVQSFDSLWCFLAYFSTVEAKLPLMFFFSTVFIHGSLWIVFRMFKDFKVWDYFLTDSMT